MQRFFSLIVVLSAALGAQMIASAQTSTRSVSFRETPTKTGAVDGALVAPPLRERWSFVPPVTSNSPPYWSLPIIADGRVFFAYETGVPGDGFALAALSATSGERIWGPVLVRSTYPTGFLAYDGGSLIVQNSDGDIESYDGATGTLRWSTHLGNEYIISSTPTVYGGVVYVAGSFRVWAVAAATGSILWSSQEGSGSTSPIVTADSVYLTSSCSLAIRLRRSDGSEVWRSEIDCTGGGGEVGVLYRDRLYTRAFPRFVSDGMNWTLNAKTGKRIAQNPGGADPAFADGRSFFRRDDGVLEAFDVKTNRSLWTFAGFGRGVATSPHVVDGFVYAAAADGELWALHPATGAVVWSTELGAAPLSHTGCCGGGFVDMAAWDGILVVVTAQRVVALEPVSAEASFDTLVVDDSGAYRFEANSATGAFRITQCGGTLVITGVGAVTRPTASTIKLAALTDVAKVTATIDTARRTAKVKAKLVAPAGRIKIVDSNTADDVRECP